MTFCLHIIEESQRIITLLLMYCPFLSSHLIKQLKLY